VERRIQLFDNHGHIDCSSGNKFSALLSRQSSRCGVVSGSFGWSFGPSSLKLLHSFVEHPGHGKMCRQNPCWPELCLGIWPSICLKNLEFVSRIDSLKSQSIALIRDDPLNLDSMHFGVVVAQQLEDSDDDDENVSMFGNGWRRLRMSVVEEWTAERLIWCSVRHNVDDCKWNSESSWLVLMATSNGSSR
jgi:hypothetical protein